MNASDSSAQPEWDKLPHDPRGFFGLPADFDRRALKRKYNRFLRQFKPEKFPAEFQKIRAAYELLDGQLRYGSMQSETTKGFDWNTGKNASQGKFELEPLEPLEPLNSDPGSASSEPPEQIPLAEIATPIHERLQTESPESIFAEFKKSTGKSPYDYFAMALLSDVTNDDPLQFFQLLLTGISKHSHDRGLFNLLYAYLQQLSDDKSIPVVLRTVSKVINDQRFYYLTEKLWDRLLRATSFENWKKTLAACESNLNDYRVDGKLAFYLHVFPAAIWKADSEWVQETWSFFNDHSREIPNSLEMDYELSYQLLEYRKSMQNKELYYSSEIHSVIKKYFLLGGQQGDEAIIEQQSQFAQNASALLDDFGADVEYNNHQIIVWDYINEEVCQRNDLGSQMNPRELRAKIYDLMDDLNRSEYANFGARDELAYRFISWGPYIAAVILPFVLLAGWFEAQTGVIVTVLAIAGAIVFVKYRLKPDERYRNYISRKMRRRYYSHWRGRFVHLFEATQVLHGDLSDALIDVVQHHQDKLGFATWLCHYVPGDPGLYLYASASRYLR